LSDSNLGAPWGLRAEYVASVPRRTNDIQELITLLTQIIGKDVATPSAMLTSKIPGVLAAGQPGAGALVDCELWFGLGPAVEAKVLVDINATSGIQTQIHQRADDVSQGPDHAEDRWLLAWPGGATPSGLERRGAGAGLQQTPSST